MLKKYIKKISEGQDLNKAEMIDAMTSIMEGNVSPEQVSAFLIAMKMKKESPIEIAASAQVMMEKATKLPVHIDDVLDIVGTGGDCLNTFNISTTSAFVLCGAGVHVAKHGNRGVSSKSGSADTLEALHVNISLTPQKAAYLLKTVGITFLFAQVYHQSMKYVGPIRKELGIKTMFNILGPLSNPACPDTYVIGAYNKEMADMMIRVYQELQVKRAIVVHGENGMDEVSLNGPTYITELKDDKIISYTIQPEDFGMRSCELSDLIGGDSEENASIFMDILQGRKGPKRDAVILNSALALYAHHKADTIADGITLAKQSIDTKAALHKFEQFRELSNQEVAL
ncbi:MULTISPECIES: anthranilate phosphoribosyltransferase [Erysipelotrichaceae]|jgi:anthranilate phosphoribosyltransferase|uniref:anthranilate phosphoribosyltransferase n=1 Tax=Erysipelotrichaceae TaxID=128827 RepID=UPI000E3F7628|nr:MULTISPECIES: anthranilate phosphoribosyltransferase [unclassified Absiella]RGB67678.1 anthranilate phosphoribosyltransferase [Absiella sp. AM09-45]RGB77404.1 anthranilate phosphoribosyltransferase [Absiella sp. AM09-50]RGC23402.1 anthranilate phosphoribosyltransferase [Absiella sp. AM54-8XD]RHU07375.1 anthranilate phosphoribosyltransferase [Absiella sp. AM27-20]